MSFEVWCLKLNCAYTSLCAENKLLFFSFFAEAVVVNNFLFQVALAFLAVSMYI